MRLWDGQRWTTVTRPMPQPPPPPQPKKKTPSAVKVAVIIAALGDSDTTAEAPPAAVPAPTQTASKAAPSETPKPEASLPAAAKVGEKVRDADYQFVVTRVTCGVKRVGDRYFGEKAQGQFCMVGLKVKNMGKEPIHFSDENQALLDTKGREYSPDDEAWLYVDDSDPYAEINPGNTLKTTVPFDVPKRAKPDFRLLKAGTWGFSEGVRVALQP
jgi:Domain of unknown function (DUF4352)